MDRKVKSFLFVCAWIGMIALALAACGGSASSTQPVNVQITLSDYKIDSSMTMFKPGVLYRFNIKNNGTMAHEFEIIPPSSAPLTPDQVKQMSLVRVGGEQLTPGESATLDYTFTKAYPSGALEFACHFEGHYEAGMHTPIEVSQ